MEEGKLGGNEKSTKRFKLEKSDLKNEAVKKPRLKASPSKGGKMGPDVRSNQSQETNTNNKRRTKRQIGARKEKHFPLKESAKSKKRKV